MQISDRGVRLIAGFEGWSSVPYWDSYGGVWTRGFGETEGIGPHSPAISYSDGLARLRHLIEQRYEYAIRNLGIPLNQNQWDALCSFVWNLGAGIFTGSLRAALEARDWHRAASQMLAYDHAGGVQLEGLTRRRRAEAALFLSAGPSPSTNPLDVLTKDERGAVNAKILYSKRPWLHRHGLQVINARIAAFRKAIWLAAERGLAPDGRHTEHGWNTRNRRARYAQLWRFSK